MFVCLCNGVTEEMILSEIQKGNDSLPKLTEALNVANICGSCQDEIEEMIIKTKRCSRPAINSIFKIVEIKHGS